MNSATFALWQHTFLYTQDTHTHTHTRYTLKESLVVGLLAVLKSKSSCHSRSLLLSLFGFLCYFSFFWWFVGVVVGAFVGFVFWGYSGMELVEGYGWVVVVLILHLLENIWMARQVGIARKKWVLCHQQMFQSFGLWVNCLNSSAVQ